MICAHGRLLDQVELDPDGVVDHILPLGVARLQRQTAVKVSVAGTPTSPWASTVKAVIRYLEPFTNPPIVAVFPAPE